MRALSLLVVVALLAGCVLARQADEISYAQAVVGGAPFTDLVVEIDHAPGYAPSSLAREHMLRELRNVTGKTRINVVSDASLDDDASQVWSSEKLVALEKRTRTTQHVAPVAVLHVLYPAGKYERGGVVGITISGTQLGPITVFLDTLGELGTQVGPVPQPQQARDEIEQSTLLHEVGHAMGLVNNGLPMVNDHEDKSNVLHSRIPKSVMFWTVDSTEGIRAALLHDGRIPLYFDDADRADMRAVGGR